MSNKENVSIIKEENCCGCHACYNICPVKAITMAVDSEGFCYPEISNEKCVNCGKCLNTCPTLNPPELNPLDIAYACYAKDFHEHMSSSSGGIFAVLARKCIEEKGIVFGAAFNRKMEVQHLEISHEDELYKLKGTKYVQSLIGTSYSRVMEELIKGRKVLFSGTPCQIAGLKKYLDRDYENLLCIDLICHGVPSPGVWKCYLKEKFGKDNVISMQFRNKSKGVHHVTLDYTLKTGEIYSETYEESPYIRGFIANLYTRPSCFHCHFKGVHRASDITIGDFWSIQEFHPELNNQYGVSAVLVHSLKGKHWFNSIADNIEVCNATSTEVSVWNESLLRPVKKSHWRTNFFSRWEENNIAELIMELSHNVKEEERTEGRKHSILGIISRRIRKWLV